jgi:hypothetical protein
MGGKCNLKESQQQTKLIYTQGNFLHQATGLMELSALQSLIRPLRCVEAGFILMHFELKFAGIRLLE